MSERLRVLWVDDMIEDFEQYTQALREYCLINLEVCSNAEKAFNLITEGNFDSVIVDIKMKNSEIDGIELIQRCIDKKVESNFCVLSSYLYLTEYNDRLKKIDSLKIDLLDKDFPPISATDFESRFIEPIKFFIENGAKKSIKKQLSITIQENIDPFKISFSDFQNMSIFEKDKVAELAKRIAQKLLNKEFSEGKHWVFLCGSHEVTRATAASIIDVYEPKRVINYALERKLIPFEFYAPSDIDDIEEPSWADCGEDHYLKYYPSLEIELNDTPLLVHFDTGAHCTFFSFEELVESKIIKSHEVQFTETARGSRPYHSANLNIEVVLRCGLTGDTTFVHLKGQIVRDWLKSPFRRHCIAQKCMQLSPINSDGKNCLLRIGLIGRNILIENELSIVLDGKCQKTGIHPTK